MSSSSSDKVRCAHLLVKHSGSRNPKSWRDPSGAEISVRSKETARALLAGYREQIVAGASLPHEFSKFAKQYSDCSSASRGGDLGSFGRGDMQKPFEDASYALKVGEMSGVVDSDSGLHIILRIA